MKKLKRIILLVIILSLSITVFNDGSFFVTSISPGLGLNSAGKDVEELQQRLKNWGYYHGDIDGFYGWDTFLAVRDFQKRYTIGEDGIASKDTLLAMGLTKIAEKGSAYAAPHKGAGNEQLLARAINGEARGEPYVGQVAVGAVILNRTRDPKFPKTIAGVIYQPRAFTAVADGQINVPIDPKSTVVKAARDALNGWDPTNGCIYYWNPATATSKWIWSRKIIKKIGKHNFGK
ncbi:MAG: spore cortex-lytic enzyme [Clostridia bacterium]|nr:spore cortex-lytic enzyme [Clostridia bacterium]